MPVVCMYTYPFFSAAVSTLGTRFLADEESSTSSTYREETSAPFIADLSSRSRSEDISLRYGRGSRPFPNAEQTQLKSNRTIRSPAIQAHPRDTR